ncbi:uncharacterized protein PG998_014964 [Apiospora kogelbergensis]|uniref:uncharacterized protein n=1 Tax=Apiospora kogelbergensis TaxID=1337665 RepID=UPI00312EB906
MANVATSLSIEEIFDLSLSCRHFQYLITEDSFAKHIIRAKAQFSLEAQQAEIDGFYARALRRLVKRRRAIAEARPYVVAMVGLADSHMLSNGKLCYIHEDVHEDMGQRWLRILDLHNPSGRETVINIPKLTAEAIPSFENCQDYSFNVISRGSSVPRSGEAQGELL